MFIHRTILYKNFYLWVWIYILALCLKNLGKDHWGLSLICLIIDSFLKLIGKVKNSCTETACWSFHDYIFANSRQNHKKKASRTKLQGNLLLKLTKCRSSGITRGDWRSPDSLGVQKKCLSLHFSFKNLKFSI